MLRTICKWRISEWWEAYYQRIKKHVGISMMQCGSQLHNCIPFFDDLIYLVAKKCITLKEVLSIFKVNGLACLCRGQFFGFSILLWQFLDAIKLQLRTLSQANLSRLFCNEVKPLTCFSLPSHLANSCSQTKTCLYPASFWQGLARDALHFAYP